MKRFSLIAVIALAAAPPVEAQQMSGSMVPSQAAAPVGNDKLSGTGSTSSATLADRATDFGAVFDVEADFGAACDGVTDDAAAINAALQKASLQSGVLRQGLVKIPRGKLCRASTTIVVPYYMTLDLGGYNPTTGVSPDPGGGIVCDAGVSPCVSLGVSNANAPTELVNGTVTHAGGSPDASVVNVVVYGYHATIRDVLSDNASLCYKFAAHVGGASGGIHAEVWNSSAQRCSDAYIDISNFPEVYWFGGRIGAAYDYAANTYVRTENPNAAGAGAAGTVVFNGVQFNSGASTGPLHFWEFVNADTTVPSIDSTDFQVVGGHIENISSSGGVFYSDATVNQIGRLKLIGSTINAPSTSLFALNAATGISDWDLSGNILLVGPSTLNPSAAVSTFGASAVGIENLRITGGSFLNGLTLTGPASLANSAAITGVTLNGGATIGGTWNQVDAFGAIGCITNSIASGSWTIDDACDGRTSSGNASVGGTLGVTGNATIKNKLYVQPSSGDAGLFIVPSSGTNAASLYFSGDATPAHVDWQFGSAGGYGTGSHLSILDGFNSYTNIMTLYEGGNITVGESSSNTLTVEGGVSAGGAGTFNGGSLTVSSSVGNAAVSLRAPSGYGTGVVYQANGSNAWQGQAVGGGGSSGHFQLNDSANSNTAALDVAVGGNVTLGEQSSNILAVTGSVAARNGSAPSPSGSCSVTAPTGGQIAGSFKASGACAGGTVTLTFAATQANGWACDAMDETTPADLMNQTAHSTASVTFTGFMASGDTVVWKCIGF